MTLEERASRHLALSDPRRLSIVDRLAAGDRSVSELAALVAMPGNLLAHHLDVLEDAGLISRHVSEGDRRRRYVTLCRDRLPGGVDIELAGGKVVFICTHNSARSQFAAALWREATDDQVVSAGSDPSPRVHPKAIAAASEFDIDLSSAVPRGYDSIPWRPDLVVSVCDRALERGVPEGGERLHWSIPDPVLPGSIDAFRVAFDDISRRVAHLTGAKW